MWKCNNCEREFKKSNQTHSCVSFPLNNHFKGKEDVAKPLFEYLIMQIQDRIGPLKIESLPCCIHLVSDYTFGAVWAQKNNIKIDFRIDRKIEDPRFLKVIKMSANRYLYYMEIKCKDDVDDKLIDWIKESYELNN